MNQKYYINEKKQITLLVLKSDKFKEVKEEQLENIQLISLTLLVLKLNKFKEEHENLLSNLQFFFHILFFYLLYRIPSLHFLINTWLFSHDSKYNQPWPSN